MYVLMDIEWVQNENGRRWPTQIAAMRVDEEWTFLHMFFSRIRPSDESFCLWDHMAYTGSTTEEFLSAPPLAEVVGRIRAWLREDDVLCWWTVGPPEAFDEAFGKLPHKQIVLFPYLRNFLANRPHLVGSPYHIAVQLGIGHHGRRHDPRSDVEMMRRALWEILFPQKLLLGPVPVPMDDGCVRLPYVVDLRSNTVHKRGCGKLPAFGTFKEYPALKTISTNGRKACACCTKELMTARRERNRWVIENGPYQFVFSPNSNVFHTRDCEAVLSSAYDVRGTMTYQTCIARKRRPCKICKPVPPATEKIPKKERTGQTPVTSKRSLTVQEQRALRRLEQAQTERGNMKDMVGKSQQKLADLKTLTQPSYAFWSAAGYDTFHLRRCGKLDSLSNLKGFGRYEDAVRAGYRPCRQCKPTPKHNMEISLPIYSRERGYETTGLLRGLCEDRGFPCSEDEKGFRIETPKGIWWIHTAAAPYRLEHINKIYSSGDMARSHIQPRIFLSLSDAFRYIKKHDEDG